MADQAAQKVVRVGSVAQEAQDMPEHVKPILTVGRVLKLWPEWEGWDDIISWWQQGDLLAWEIGSGDGCYVLTDMVPNLRAQAHVVVTGRDFMGAQAVPMHRAWADWVMAKMQLKRLEARVPMYHTLSRRLVEAVGFTKEGVLHNYGQKGNHPVDVWVGAIVR